MLGMHFFSPANIMKELPNISRHPISSSVNTAALKVPTTISKSIIIENMPAPILLGAPKITIFVGI
jgi:3-hydroxyacyl-CoA dehydrogenase